MDIISWKDGSILRTVPGDTLQGVDLSRSNLFGADLFGTNLSGTDLIQANLSQANLTWANLSRAELSGADLFQAKLSESNLSQAYLSGTNLSQADLTGADLTHAELSGTDLTDTILPNGMTLPEYLAWLPSGLLTQGGKTLEEVATAWGNLDWTDCPMATAFSVHSLEEIPECHRQGAALFIALYDGGHLPKPI
jgi:hypothetical protein